ncbi:hypothetical protein NDU88_004677 [Pleurodeles waltl]|uniref:Uncharacterized protein n=1 Tax=Pleurodeles waltl TaxID=8319 RepID=A0AAV7NKC4_PLEWA|nr:hypothetical protein NDU88_004677 [Pleurodeles waltl]
MRGASYPRAGIAEGKEWEAGWCAMMPLGRMLRSQAQPPAGMTVRHVTRAGSVRAAPLSPFLHGLSVQRSLARPQLLVQAKALAVVGHRKSINGTPLHHSKGLPGRRHPP